MKERPILFSGAMVRAILEGRKTQTRRIWKMPKWAEWDIDRGEARGYIIPKDPKCRGWYSIDEIASPYGREGDQLWVREAWWQDTRDSKCAVMDADGYVVDVHPCSKATGTIVPVDDFCTHLFWRKRPSIHMPRWASRIQLEITDIRVERLQDIGQGDSCAEGCPIGFEPLDWYRNIWESINGSGSWDANPWVWCISFRRIET